MILIWCYYLVLSKCWCLIVYLVISSFIKNFKDNIFNKISYSYGINIPLMRSYPLACIFTIHNYEICLLTPVSALRLLTKKLGEINHSKLFFKLFKLSSNFLKCCVVCCLLLFSQFFCNTVNPFGTFDFKRPTLQLEMFLKLMKT